MKEKNYNLELIRNISFIMVILIHIANYFCRAVEQISFNEYLFALTINTIARVSVPCFFMISGALLLGRKESSKKCLQRAWRFIIILVVWSFIYYLFNTYYTHQPWQWTLFLDDPAEDHLWYLYVLIPIYIILPFLQSMCRGMDEKLEHAFAIIGTIWVFMTHLISYTNLDIYYDLPIFGSRSYIYYLYMGYYLMKYRKQILKNVKFLIFTFITSTAANIIIVAGYSILYHEHYERTLEYGNPLVIISALSFFLLMLEVGETKINWNSKNKKWMDLAASYSLGIYLVHIIFLDIYKMNVPPNQYPVYFIILILLIVILILSVLTVYLLRKLPFGKKIT